MKKVASALACTLALGVSGTAAFAQSADQTPRPGARNESNVSFITGGVGVEEREQLQQMARDRNANLKVVLAEPDGQFLSDIEVSVRDRKGNTVLRTMTNGPWLLAKLPPGSYRITASMGDKRKDQTVSVAAEDLRTVYFRFSAAS